MKKKIRISIYVKYNYCIGVWVFHFHLCTQSACLSIMLIRWINVIWISRALTILIINCNISSTLVVTTTVRFKFIWSRTLDAGPGNYHVLITYALLIVTIKIIPNNVQILFKKLPIYYGLLKIRPVGVFYKYTTF